MNPFDFDYKAAVLAQYPEAELYQTQNGKWAIDLSKRAEDVLFIYDFPYPEHAWSTAYYHLKETITIKTSHNEQ